MNKKSAQKIINQTRKDYNKIAEHFASTRQYIYPDIGKILDKLKISQSKTILDLGCGNGRFADYFLDKKAEYSGLDISEKLIEIAREKHPKGHFTVGEITKLPYPDNHFDLVLSIATIHHLPSKPLRKEAYLEMSRVVKPKGKIILTVWYFWHRPEIATQIIRAYLGNLFRNESWQFGDFYKPWRDAKKNVVISRYFHAFRKSELKANLSKHFIIKDFYLNESDRDITKNLIAILTKR